MCAATSEPTDSSRPRPHYHGHRQRLAERLRQSGAKALADYEWLEFLLTYAIPRRDVKPLAKTLLTQFGSLAGLLAAPPEVLARVPGLGPRSVALLRLLAALPGRLQMPSSVTAPAPLPDAATLAAYCRLRLQAGSREQAVVLYFGPGGTWLRHEELAEGGASEAPLFPRQIAESALTQRAVAVVVAHNHPSGHCHPSAADLELTQTLVAALGLLEIRLQDHLILAGDQWFSFREQGLLPR